MLLLSCGNPVFFLSANVESFGDSFGDSYTFGIAGTGGTSSSLSGPVDWLRLRDFGAGRRDVLMD